MYLCSTPNRLARMFGDIADKCLYFGHGYSDKGELEDGIEAIETSFSPDLLVISDFILSLKQYRLLGISPDKYMYASRRLTQFKPDAAFDAFWEETLEYLLSSKRKTPLAATLLETDLYRASESFIADLDSVDLLVGPGRQFCSKIAEAPRIREEVFASAANDRMASLYESRRRDTISCLDFVCKEDFLSPLTKLKANDWAVPGVLYSYRKEAVRVLEESNIKVKYGRSLVARVMYYKYCPYQIRKNGLKLYQAKFRQQLHQSQYAYTCGSGGRAPVTKMFEIPAAGCILVCESFINSSEAGYIDSYNYIEARPDELTEVASWLKQDTVRAENIAINGYKMVQALHSYEARVIQIRRSLYMWLEKRFRGSEWTNGSYTWL